MPKASYAPPLTFDLTRSQYRAIRRKAVRRGFTQSNFVRDAIRHLDAIKIPATEPRYRQISVRLETPLRRKLAKIARQKNASVGEILRHALNQASA